MNEAELAAIRDELCNPHLSGNVAAKRLLEEVEFLNGKVDRHLARAELAEAEHDVELVRRQMFQATLRSILTLIDGEGKRPGPAIWERIREIGRIAREALGES